MVAEISKRGEITIVRLKGRLDFETPEPFKRTCLAKLKNEKVVFNLQELNFVGSCGITIFLDLLNEFSTSNSVKPKFCGLNSEFRRLFLSIHNGPVEIYDDQVKALSAFDLAVSVIDFASQQIAETAEWTEDEEKDFIEDPIQPV
ncbi:MAG: STAS domain-containing protein [Bdellovibrionales bacterium]